MSINSKDFAVVNQGFICTGSVDNLVEGDITLFDVVKDNITFDNGSNVMLRERTVGWEDERKIRQLGDIDSVQASNKTNKLLSGLKSKITTIPEVQYSMWILLEHLHHKYSSPCAQSIHLRRNHRDQDRFCPKAKKENNVINNNDAFTIFPL